MYAELKIVTVLNYFIHLYTVRIVHINKKWKLDFVKKNGTW
jgi:hypothetical protein